MIDLTQLNTAIFLELILPQTTPDGSYDLPPLDPDCRHCGYESVDSIENHAPNCPFWTYEFDGGSL